MNFEEYFYFSSSLPICGVFLESTRVWALGCRLTWCDHACLRKSWQISRGNESFVCVCLFICGHNVVWISVDERRLFAFRLAPSSLFFVWRGGLRVGELASYFLEHILLKRRKARLRYCLKKLQFHMHIVTVRSCQSFDLIKYTTISDSSDVHVIINIWSCKQ